MTGGRLVARAALASAFALALFGAFLGTAGGAAGHALLLSSDPAAGTSLPSAPSSVTLTFGETPDAKLSRILVLDTAGTDHATGPVEAVAGQGARLRVAVGPLSDGVYTVAWRAVSAVDGHTSAGSFAFGVGAGTVVTGPAPAGAGAGTSAGSGLGVIARWIFYLGLALLLGASLIGAILHPRPPRRIAVLAGWAWLVAAIGAAGVVLFQWLDSGAALPDFLASSLGVLVLGRGATVALTAIPVAVLWRRQNVTTARPLFGAALVLAASTLLADVVAGHAAASTQQVFAVTDQWLHGLSAGLWMGGLAALLVAVRGLPTD